jgi:hypothetical protein
MRPFLLSLVILAACGGATTRTQPELPPVPPAATTGTLAGPLCSGTACRCLEEGGDAGAPSSAAVKRFEIKVGPVDNDLWVMVDDMVLYKTRERATECFYVDLASPGDHTVAIRAHGDPAFGARVAISEMRAAAEDKPLSWYETFRFGCGGPGACDQAQLHAWRDSLAKYKRGIHDPCGSVKIKGIEWDTGKMPDTTVPADLYVKFVMQLYKFSPDHAHGDPACASKFE